MFALLKSKWTRWRILRGFRAAQWRIQQDGIEVAAALIDAGPLRDPFDIGYAMVVAQATCMADGVTARGVIADRVYATCNTYGEWTFHNPA